MKKIKIGDVFEIPTSKGKGYFQYVFEGETIGELIRVLPGLYPEQPEDLSGIVESQERYLIHFPVQAALNRRIIFFVGNYPLPKSFRIPEKFRSKFVDKSGNLLHWDIVDYQTWKREQTKELTEEQKKLSEWGSWNDTLLIERLEQGWSLEKWV